MKLIEGLRLIEVLIKLFEDIDLNGQRAAETRLGIIRMLTGYEEILQQWRTQEFCSGGGRFNKFS